jgi:hypothetical protein
VSLNSREHPGLVGPWPPRTSGVLGIRDDRGNYVYLEFPNSNICWDLNIYIYTIYPNHHINRVNIYIYIYMYIYICTYVLLGTSVGIHDIVRPLAQGLSRIEQSQITTCRVHWSVVRAAHAMEYVAIRLDQNSDSSLRLRTFKQVDVLPLLNKAFNLSTNASKLPL